MESKYSVFDLQEAARHIGRIIENEDYDFYPWEVTSLLYAIGVIEEELKRRESAK